MPHLRTTVIRRGSIARPRRFRLALGALVCTALLGGCASLPPGANYPRTTSFALEHPEQTVLGAKFAQAAVQHDGKSAFRILNVGVDGFLTRVQMIDAAQRTLDLQYFIFRGDETGRLITAALRRAADRGVHIRLLIDDGDTVPGDEQIFSLIGHQAVEIRVFNPFAYRGHSTLRRGIEFLLHKRRLDYRMHNKLFVVDNSVALVGGRNIGNQYFQMDPESQFADDDVFTFGPIVQKLSASFDEFWNSTRSIPAAALGYAKHPDSDPEQQRKHAQGRKPIRALDSPGIDYVAMLRTDEPFAGMVTGALPLVWANAELLVDSPDKKKVEKGESSGHLMADPVVEAAAEVQSELLMITPYFVPTNGEMQVLDTLLRNNKRVAILTNSLEAAPALLAQSGYANYRIPLLDDGADLYEVRARLGSRRGSGQTSRISSFGNYSLHAKLYVFDRQRFFIGSMNFDERSKHLNTEIGLIIDSPELAQQTAIRFDNMTQPENAFILSLRYSRSGRGQYAVWDTVENGKPVEYSREPARSRWQKLKLKILALLPFRSEL